LFPLALFFILPLDPKINSSPNRYKNMKRFSLNPIPQRLISSALLLFSCHFLSGQAGDDVLTPRSVSIPMEANQEDYTADADYFLSKAIDTLSAPSIIAFGSCNKLDKPQNIWEAVSANHPQLWIWLGDIIYGDTTDMRALAKMYKTQKNNPGYKSLRQTAQVIGIYDDHDYGANDAGATYPFKKQSKKILMDFLDVPLRAPVRRREGAYTSYTFGTAPQSIKVIVLDTRYFRDSLQADPTKQRRYLPNLEGDILGEEQWKWLEEELQNSTANLNILCSSIQILPDEHAYEKWSNFPASRKRLLSLIYQIQPKNLLLLSGDRHMAEISRMDIQGLPYPLYDFTSSGLTHIRSTKDEPNRYRVGEMQVKRNFGILKIQWNNDRPVVTMQIRGLQNELFQEQVVRY